MPFLDAKALETDPDGMAFLRAVIRPDFEREPAAPSLPLQDSQPGEVLKQGQPDVAGAPIRSELAIAAHMG